MELQIFRSERFGVIRAFQDEKNNPLFAAVDVARALGYKNPAEAIATHCKSSDIEKRYVANQNGTGGNYLQVINEPNVYRLIMRSNLESAVLFQDWVFEDVLPELRAKGGYLISSEEDTEASIMAKAVLIANSTIDRIKTQNKQLELQNQIQKDEIKELTPLADLAKECYVSTGSMTATTVASRLGFRSANAMNKHLKSIGVQYKVKSDECWKLVAKYSCNNYTRTIPTSYLKPDGTIGTRNSMEWTEAGFVFLREMLTVKMLNNV